MTETTGHLLVDQCPHAYQIRQAVASWCNTDDTGLFCIGDAVGEALIAQGPPEVVHVWQVISYITAWSVWKARNNLVMEISLGMPRQYLAIYSYSLSYGLVADPQNSMSLGVLAICPSHYGVERSGIITQIYSGVTALFLLLLWFLPYCR